MLTLKQIFALAARDRKHRNQILSRDIETSYKKARFNLQQWEEILKIFEKNDNLESEDAKEAIQFAAAAKNRLDKFTQKIKFETEELGKEARESELELERFLKERNED